MAEKIVLGNGVRVLLDQIPHLRSVSAGIWVAAGSRQEEDRDRGASHFIEHMLFKGTRRRTARQIALEIDSVGGVLNGFTSREYSSFSVKVMDTQLPVGMDLLTDLYLNSVFDPQELERERGVILQEIRMIEDSPEEHVVDLFYEGFWRGSPMGYPIQGDAQSVSLLRREELLARLQRHYHHSEVMVCVAGRFETSEVLHELEGRLGGLTVGPMQPDLQRPQPHPGIRLVHKDLEQVHVCLGTAAPCAAHPDRHAYWLLNTVLGGGMSSRLFQEVREKRGLAYSIYSFVNPYADTGTMNVYMGTSREGLREALEATLSQMERLAQAPLDEETLRCAREQIKGGVILGMESSERRMGRLARNELYFGREITLEELLDELDAVDSTAVLRAAQEAFRLDALAGVILGRVSMADLPCSIRALLA
jgi:predicted Zn-dependent peptidase